MPNDFHLYVITSSLQDLMLCIIGISTFIFYISCSNGKM